MSSGAPPTTQVPDVIGPYTVLRPIARGGMSEVYEVVDHATGEHFALKLLLQGGIALDRFNREYEAMIRLNHPNIVRVYYYGLHGESPWLTMELVQGTPVQAYAKRLGRPGTPARNNEVIRVAHDIARALDHIHLRGLVHRDLKSANVLVLADGRVKLLDFGSARILDAEQITRDGEFVGTFAYASPEQLMGRIVDYRSDLYSLGVLLYRLATGKRPFESDDLHTLAKMHVKQPPRPPSELVPSIPKRLEDVILSLLEKTPASRPASCALVAEQLEQVVGKPLVLPGTLEPDESSSALLGRESELALLRGVLDEQEPGAFVLLLGLEGAGRDRVLRAVEQDARGRGWSVFRCVLDPEQSLARLTVLFRQIAESFGDSVNERAAKAAQIVERVSRTWSMASVRRREYLATSGVVLLSERCRLEGNPVLVSIEGLHDAGPGAVDLLVALREGLVKARAPVLFVADLDEVKDDAAGPIRKRLSDALRVDLPPLGEHQVALLVGSLLSRRPPPAALARQIHAAAGGLPTFVEEVVHKMVRQGILQEGGFDSNRLEWAQRESMEISVPDKARRGLVARLLSLPAAHRRVLEALALAGDHGSPKTLATGLETASRELAPTLGDLRSRGWIATSTRHGGTLQWRHELSADIVLDHLHPARRNVLQRRLADAFVDQPASATQVALLLATDRLDEAIPRAVKWAEEHLAANRPATALEVLDPVVADVKRARRPSRSELAYLFLLHAHCLLEARPLDPLVGKSLGRAEALGEGLMFKAELALTRARQQAAIGHLPNYRRFLQQAWALVEEDPPPRLASAIARHLGESHAQAGAVDAAGEWFEVARKQARLTGNAVVRAEADVGVARLLLSRGLLLQAEETAIRAVEVFDEREDASGLSMVLPIWAAALRHQGRFSQALDVLGSVVPRFRQAEAPSYYVRLLIALAWLEADLCRLGRAQELVDELAATLRKGEHLDLRLQAELVRGRICVASGRLSEALQVLYGVTQRATTAGLVVTAEHARALLGEALAAAGQSREAGKAFDQALSRLARAGSVPALMEACVSAGRALGTETRPDEIFRPVASFLKTQPAEVVRLEWVLAQGRYVFQMGRDPADVYAMARQTLDRMARDLNDTDRAALRVHPWSRQIRVGLGESDRQSG